MQFRRQIISRKVASIITKTHNSTNQWQSITFKEHFRMTKVTVPVLKHTQQGSQKEFYWKNGEGNHRIIEF